MSCNTKTDGTLTVTDGIVKLSEDVFCVNGTFRSLPGLTFPLRCTIIRLPGDKLIVYSPFNPELIDISSLGTIETIIVPNMVHCSYGHALKEQNPDATIYIAPSAKSRFEDRDWGTVIEDDKPKTLAPGVKLVCMTLLKPFQEILLLYEPTKTLLVADFAFNLTDHALKVASTGAKFYVWCVNGKRTLAIGSTLENMVRPHCKEALPQVESLLSMDWDAVIPCHGEVVASGAKDAYKENVYKFMKQTAEEEISLQGTAIWVALLALIIGAALYKFSKSY